MNGETANQVPPVRRRTRAEQRALTRRALLDATVATLVEQGYAGLTSRNVAERAGVAQSTFMHYFPTRDAFLIEAVEHVALRLLDDALDQIDLAALRSPRHRERVLDQAWREFTSPEALAAAQLWAAVWTEPDLGVTLRDVERRLESIIAAAAATLFPDQAEDPRFPALIDLAVSLIRGLVDAIPVHGREVVDARWEAIKPIVIEATGRLLD
ncbi:MAG TPA: TetR/AcrR family transcriptional regulator [Solirubrobacteraceae bacterium]|nr:TetR/AcrR family transcriptional regulator [Solirubrobacteraceae bacterium]